MANREPANDEIFADAWMARSAIAERSGNPCVAAAAAAGVDGRGVVGVWP